MIYTIVPIEQVLDNEIQSEQVGKSVRAVYLEEDVLLSVSEKGEYSVERLLSTNPQSFLKSELYPGSKVDAKGINI